MSAASSWNECNMPPKSSVAPGATVGPASVDPPSTDAGHPQFTTSPAVEVLPQGGSVNQYRFVLSSPIGEFFSAPVNYAIPASLGADIRRDMSLLGPLESSLTRIERWDKGEEEWVIV